MFTAAGKLWGYLWGPESKESEDKSKETEEPSIDDENVSNRKEVLGTITHIFSNHGLIDSEIYFSFDHMMGGVRPTVNAKVNVVAVQQYAGGGWHAEQVSVSEDWEEEESDDDDDKKDQELSYPTDVVGHVTYCSDRTGYVNDNIFYDLNQCKCDNFKPSKGDWVKVKVSYSENKMDVTATELQPLRVKQTEGVISGVMGDHGYVDGEVFFMNDALVNGYNPRKWDPVYYTAVESLQGRCSWRATLIEPSKKPEVMNLKMIQGPLQMAFTKELLADKEGVTILQDPHFGTVSVGSRKLLTVWVKNNGCSPHLFKRCHVTVSSSQLKLKSVRLVKENSINRDSGTVVTGEVMLDPGMTLNVDIELEARTSGEEKQLFIFTFEKFKIGRYVMASIVDPMIDMFDDNHRPYAAASRQAYGRYRRTMEKTSAPWLVPGERRNRAKARTVQYPNRLPKYEVADELRETVHHGEDLLHHCPALGQPLCYNNYKEKLSHLLHLEEIQMDIDIREFDLDRVCLRHMGEYLGLTVPGLAEGRPSVLLGDKVMLTDPGDPDGPVYEGYVHEMTKDMVLLKFNPAFHSSYNGKDYDAIFTFNRGPLRKSHKATDLALRLGESVLFPTSLMPKPSRLRSGRHKSAPVVPASPSKAKGASSSCCGLEFFNKSLNSRQKSAVVRIVEGQGRPLPYILFGPPGTGKTVTVVEAVLQVFRLLPSSRIIVCTPSNSAADLVTQRLHESGLVTSADLVRLNALQRSEESIPGCIKPYCTVGDDMELSARYRILVSTCVSAGTLYSLGIKPGHFTHVFIDEAGQATEPEAMISECLVSETDGQIVLAGDPQQLGPVLRSKFAKLYGLEVSHLERLISTHLYERNEQMFADHGAYDPLLVTKLVYNYRSHPAILDLPSRLFYHGELVPKAAPTLINTFLGWDQLPTKHTPVIFHGVRGKDTREGDSPSWFNPNEAVLVVQYLQAVLKSCLLLQGKDTREGDSPSWFNPNEAVLVVQYLQAVLKSELVSSRRDDIGIITPYRKQVEKIRLLIDKLGMDSIKVGSVEEFQGQERQVIIVSTVRANEDLIGFDTRHTLGFLSNPKRFNVTVTRAQALLVVIGNPHVLAQDQYWQAMIEYCVENGAYTGCDLPPTSLRL